MQTLPVSDFPVVQPEDADPELSKLYDVVRQETGLPVIPNWATALASSPGSLRIYLEMYRAFHQHITLPQTIVPMILYAVATARNCTYCSLTNESYCRTLGVEEETLDMMANDLDNVSPERLRAIIQFSVRCALEPQMLTPEDYESVRDQGINDDELAQIIFLSALANFNDTLADSFKMEVESHVLEALGR